MKLISRWSVRGGTDSSSDLLIDSVENTVDGAHEKEADDEPHELGVDPVSHENVLFMELNVLCSFLLSSEFKMFHCNNEVGDVAWKSKSNLAWNSKPDPAEYVQVWFRQNAQDWLHQKAQDWPRLKVQI